MPELPEVETTRKAVAKVVATRRIERVVMRRANLRWPMPMDLPQKLANSQVMRCERRGKYLLFFCDNGVTSGWLLIHLGMSGTLCDVLPNRAVTAHDHVDFDCGDVILRYNDPRRFGAILWLEGTFETLPSSPLLDHLGVEPFGQACTAAHLYQASRGLKIAVKQWLLAGKAVVGVGNIYCSESLFFAGIHPAKPAGKLTKNDCERLLTSVLSVLQAALDAGGTTLNDFVSGAHTTGNYQDRAVAYGRAGEPCVQCGQAISLWLRDGKAVGGRATYFCKHCQRK
jgi:formamidopyrimidine-DNA glycosylase